MPHFFIRQSANFSGTIPEVCQDELLFAVQDTISLQLDCPMVRVTYSTAINVDPTLVDQDIVVSVYADAKMWSRLWESKPRVKREVKNTIGRKLIGVVDESRILVTAITSIPTGRSFR